MRTGIQAIDDLRATTIVGIDEAGYGAWAGPLYAAAVAVHCTWEGEPDIRDSKQLTARQRQAVFDRYCRTDISGVAVGVGRIGPDEIDAVGAYQALQASHRRALLSIQGQLSCKPFVVVDGIVRPDIEDLADQILCLPKADSRVPVVSLASIVAKVIRDREMYNLSGLFPGYGFDRNMGYGTMEHRLAIERLGVCEIHRKSYAPVRKLLG
jgi:ribonuclease HII